MNNLTRVLQALVVLSGPVLLAGCHGARPATLGVRDGRLAPCPSSPNCVSSLARRRRAPHRAVPVRRAGRGGHRPPGGHRALAAADRRWSPPPETYLHAEFSSAVFRFVDDVEFFADETGRRDPRPLRLARRLLGPRRQPQAGRNHPRALGAERPPRSRRAKPGRRRRSRPRRATTSGSTSRSPGGAGKLSLFVAYPERKDKAPVVLVIHEVYGLTDWIRAVADRLAADGFIAIAPDMLTGRGPGGGGTEKFAAGTTPSRRCASSPRRR